MNECLQLFFVITVDIQIDNDSISHILLINISLNLNINSFQLKSFLIDNTYNYKEILIIPTIGITYLLNHKVCKFIQFIIINNRSH